MTTGPVLHDLRIIQGSRDADADRDNKKKGQLGNMLKVVTQDTAQKSSHNRGNIRYKKGETEKPR